MLRDSQDERLTGRAETFSKGILRTGNALVSRCDTGILRDLPHHCCRMGRATPGKASGTGGSTRVWRSRTH